MSRERLYKGDHKTTCSKCGNPLELKRQNKYRYCLACHALYNRENRKKYSQCSQDEKKKINARAYANVYVSRGKLLKKPCVICGKTKVEMHHNDYNKPLEVIWYCRKHHLEEHGIINVEL